MYEGNIFFGDSITAGSNSNSRFSDYFYGGVVNKGVSGTTIGEYSIYPVDGNSLISKYNCSDIRFASNIFLEYGINDVSAIMCDFTDLNKVVLNFVKALDGIKQINKFAKIYWLSISDDVNIIFEHSKLQCKYLAEDYFKGYDFVFPATTFADNYIQLLGYVRKRLPIIPMMNSKEFLTTYLSDDNIHPNEEGHKVIANNIKTSLGIDRA